MARGHQKALSQQKNQAKKQEVIIKIAKEKYGRRG